MSTRVVSRLYTDYFPTDNPYGKCITLQDDATSFKKQLLVSHRSDVENGAVTKPASAQGSKSKRIFIARIPSNVTEEDLKKHFEEFGVIEDAYRPRDFAKNTFRGIGFITFSEATTVDRVIAMKHSLGGQEVIIDRATPKETTSVKNDASQETLKQNKQASYVDDSVRTIRSEAMVNNYTTPSLRGSFNEQTFDVTIFNCIPPAAATYPNSNGNNRGPPSNFSDDFPTEVVTTPQAGFTSDVYNDTTGALRNGSSIGNNRGSRITRSMAEEAMGGRNSKSGNSSTGLSPRARTTTTTSTTTTGAAKTERNQKTVTDNFAHVRKVRGGPRIFVGKISKDTCEQDLADHFSQFGFVMDVYIPRSRENKKEHRGFGFVTFETEASIKRAISQGTHNLKGAVLAIDVAVPENSANV